MRPHPLALLRTSSIFDRVWRLWEEAPDRDLYIGIVTQAATETALQFPRSEFHVLFWGVKETGLAPALGKRGIRVHRVRDLLDDYRKQYSRYILHELDRHPNAFALDRLSEYVGAEIIDKEG